MPASQYPLPHAKDGDDYRLNLQHEIFRETLDGRLLNALPDEPVTKALEIGAGSGIWAAEFANENPEAQVLGVDLFEPTVAPPSNCRFVVRDIVKDWDLGETDFDLIHTRMVLFHLSDVENVLRKAFEHLRPGGIIEMQEMWLPFRTDEPLGAPEHSSPVIVLSYVRAEAAKNRGFNQSIAGLLPEMLADLGFTDIQVRDEKWPIGTWMEDDRMKIRGEKFRHCQALGTRGFSQSLMTRELGMTEEEVQQKVDETLAALGVGKIYVPMRFVSAKKPQESSG